MAQQAQQQKLEQMKALEEQQRQLAQRLKEEEEQIMKRIKAKTSTPTPSQAEVTRIRNVCTNVIEFMFVQSPGRKLEPEKEAERTIQEQQKEMLKKQRLDELEALKRMAEEKKKKKCKKQMMKQFIFEVLIDCLHLMFALLFSGGETKEGTRKVKTKRTRIQSNHSPASNVPTNVPSNKYARAQPRN